MEQLAINNAIQSVTIIGSGNVAAWFAFACARAGITVQQVYGRDTKKCRILAESCGAEPISDLYNLRSNSDLFIFSVKDDVYTELIERVPFRLPLAVITAGSVSRVVLSPIALSSGVLYPCQTLTQGTDFKNVTVPLCVEGGDEDTLVRLMDFARLLTAEVYAVSEARRAKLHLAAVFASNFSNAMCAIAFHILGKADMDSRMLLPLLENTVNKLRVLSPIEAQTGPARRHDTCVMQQHLNALHDTDLQEIYKLISAYIMKNYL